MVEITSTGTIARTAAKRRPRMLCATDLSPGSEMTMQRAVLLMQPLDAELLLLHVIDEAQSAHVIRREATRAKTVLEERAAILTRAGCHPEISVRVGAPHRTIARAARKWGADVIVLGPCRRQFGDSLFGTTAERVMRAARIPVLNVNREPSGPYVDVLLATDRDDSFVAVASLTADLKLLNGARTSIVHAFPSASRAMLYSAGITESQLGQYLRYMKQTSADALAAQLASAALDSPKIPIVQENADPLPAIGRAVGFTDLLVIGASRYPVVKRVLLGSASNEVLRTVRCDVLLVSPAAAMHARARAGARRTPARQGAGETSTTRGMPNRADQLSPLALIDC